MEQMKQQHNFVSEDNGLKWGYTTLENVMGEWDYCDEYVSVSTCECLSDSHLKHFM